MDKEQPAAYSVDFGFQPKVCRGDGHYQAIVPLKGSRGRRIKICFFFPHPTSYHHTLIRANDSKTSKDKMKKKKKKWMHVSGSILQKLLLLHLSALVGFFKGLHIGEGKPISSLCNLYLDNQCLVADFSSDWARTAHLSFSVPQKPGQSLLITIIPIITSFFLQWTVPLSGQQQWIPSNYQT